MKKTSPGFSRLGLIERRGKEGMSPLFPSGPEFYSGGEVKGHGGKGPPQ